MENTKNIITKYLNNLVINDKNSSISYNKSELNNNIDIKQIETLRELNDWYKAGNDIFTCDTINCVSLILDDNIEIPLYKYSNQHVIFLKISTFLLTKDKNELLIAADNNHYIPKNDDMQWQTCYIEVFTENHIPDSNGLTVNHSAVNKMIQKSENFRQLEAISYCLDQEISVIDVNDFNIVYQGYLPTIDQLVYMYLYNDLINEILVNIDSKPYFMKNKQYWSCTEYSTHVARYMQDGQHEIGNKTNKFKVFPLFKQKYMIYGK